MADRDVQLRKQRAEDHATSENSHCNFRNNKRNDGNYGKHIPRAGTESPLQEFRHGENHGAHVEGHEDPRQYQQAPGMEFVVRKRHAASGARSRQSDDVFGTDIRRKDRCADDPPTKVSSSQEIIRRRVFAFSDHPPGHDQQDPKVNCNDDPINFGELRARCGCQQCDGWVGAHM